MKWPVTTPKDCPMLDPLPVASSASTSQKIAAFQSELTRRGLDAFIVPRFDAHQGEYIAPHDQRLHFLTGFSGSAGMAIVTHSGIAMFVDGRYSVQVQNECTGPLFTYHHLFETPPDTHVAEGRAGVKIGFDPMLIPPAWYDRFLQACAKSGAEMLPQTNNPVNVIWADQPAAPTGKISSFPLQFSGCKTQDKLAALSAELRTHEAQWHVETQPDNIAWLLNIRGSDVAFNPIANSFLLAHVDGAVQWFVAPEKLDEAVRDSLPDCVSLWPDAAFLPTLSQQVRSGQTAMIDPDFSPIAVRLALAGVAAQVIQRPSVLTRQKAQKNATEIEGMRACHLEDGVAWTEFSAWLLTTVPMRATSGAPLTEREAEQKMRAFRAAQPGFLDDSFNPISAAGRNAAMCHYATDPDNAVPVLPGHPYLLDSGGQYETGTTDATRSFSFGLRPTGYDRAYTAVFKAFHALATLRFPKGTQGHHIDAICRRPLWDLGLDYDHGTGHGVGHRLSVHEHPQRIGKAHNPVDLMPGMVLSIEPGHYVAQHYGIRIENLFVVVEAEDGFYEFQNLTWAPIQTEMLLLDDLSPAERQWLASYHAALIKQIGPRLSAPALAFVKALI